MALREIVFTALALLGILLCFGRGWHVAFDAGFEEGANEGFLAAIKSLCDEEIVVDGRKLIFKGKHVGLYDNDTNERLTELDMDDLTFKEVKL